MALLAQGLTDVVVAQGAAILKLLAGEDESLLVWGDAERADDQSAVATRVALVATYPSLSWILALTASIESLDST